MPTVSTFSGFRMNNKTLHAGHDGFVFTIAIESSPTLCLDAGGDGSDGTLLQAWECNGQESQLWFFDSGAYQIQWAGDSSKCIDAGDMSQGSQLVLWDCNGYDQQKWAYDGTIYLAIDNPMCMDLYGGGTDGGTPIVVWDCMHIWSQTWTVSSGITIRTSSNYQLCLDLAGESTDNGTPVQLWECNGLWDQKWILEDWQIKLASDTSKCVDAGGLSAGNLLMLWDCNGQDQQLFGYDGTIFLSSSPADASLCVDLPGGLLDWGTQLEVYDCNSCWNQQFDVTGPVDVGMVLHQPREQSLASLNRNLTVGGCPPSGGPSPPPGAGSSHCSHAGDQHGWPVFDDEASLQASNWAGYFQDVYGEIPHSGYPICIYNFFWLYPDTKAAHGCDEGGNSPKKCPAGDGAYYKVNNKFDKTIKNSAWIYHPSPYAAIPGSIWIEVTHSDGLCAGSEGHGMWFFYTEGSGIWFNTGETRAFQDHGESGKALCGHQVAGFDSAIKCAQDAGINSVQYLGHPDGEYECNFKKLSGHAWGNIEIVGTIGYNGDKLKGSLPCGNKSGQGVFKAGWEGSQDCSCDNSKHVANCALGPGFPPNF